MRCKAVTRCVRHPSRHTHEHALFRLGHRRRYKSQGTGSEILSFVATPVKPPRCGNCTEESPTQLTWERRLALFMRLLGNERMVFAQKASVVLFIQRSSHIFTLINAPNRNSAVNMRTLIRLPIGTPDLNSRQETIFLFPITISLTLSSLQWGTCVLSSTVKLPGA